MKNAVAITITLFVLAIALPVMAAEDGAAIFARKCAACHGKTGAGDTAIGKSKRIKDLGSPVVQKLTDEELTNMIATGGARKTPGHAFKSKGLTENQIKAIVAFIRTLKK